MYKETERKKTVKLYFVFLFKIVNTFVLFDNFFFFFLCYKNVFCQRNSREKKRIRPKERDVGFVLVRSEHRIFFSSTRWNNDISHLKLRLLICRGNRFVKRPESYNEQMSLSIIKPADGKQVFFFPLPNKTSLKNIRRTVRKK